MYRIVYIFFILFFLGCSQKTIILEPKTQHIAQENLYILYALEAENKGSYSLASELFAQLYAKTSNKEYLYKEIEDLLAAREYEKALELIEKSKQTYQDDLKLMRLESLAYFHQKQYDKAKQLALEIAEKTQDKKDFLIVADIFYTSKEYQKSLKYYEKAYKVDFNPVILDRISVILFSKLKKQKEAVQRLKTHINLFGCNERLCLRLSTFYSYMYDEDGLLSVLKRYYDMTENQEVLKKITALYLHKKDTLGLEQFLESHQIENELLLQLYVSGKKYKKAASLSKKLYKQTKDIDYLGQNAIFSFESKKRHSKKELNEIVSKLERVVKKKPIPLYLNYLGYLLIDNDIDIKKGIKYVKEALKDEPSSAYYLDSLAWGYYKLGKCYKAYKLFKKIQKLPKGDDKEIQKHFKIVKRCLYKRRKK